MKLKTKMPVWCADMIWRKYYHLWIFVFICLAGASSQAQTFRYVSGDNTAPLSPYTNWFTAATNIEDAIGISDPWDTIWVTNGSYEICLNTNVLRITNAISIRSINGAENTTIKVSRADGLFSLYHTNTFMDGFAFTGGRLYVKGTVQNCYIYGIQYTNLGPYVGCVTLRKGSLLKSTVSDCMSFLDGGGVYASDHATIENCRILNNTANSTGGGICINDYLSAGSVRIVNCLIAGNYAGRGGGIYSEADDVVIENCTVANNEALTKGGGLYSGAGDCNIFNSIIYSNSLIYTNTLIMNIYGGVTAEYCCSPRLSGSGNVTQDPKYVYADIGDYRLTALSPCLDAGTNRAWMTTNETDIAGSSRIFNGIVDMGAYETSVMASGTDIVSNQAYTSWYTGTGTLCQLQYCSFLEGHEWLNLGTVTTSETSFVSFPDTMELSSNRFYRLRWQLAP